MTVQNRRTTSGCERKISMYTGKKSSAMRLQDSPRKRVRISALHLAAFLFIYVCNILLFFAFRGYFFLIMWVILTALIPFSFYTAWRLVEYIDGTIVISKENVRPGETVEVVLSINNRSLLCALRGTWLLTVGNSFYQTYDDQKLVLSVPPHGKRQFSMTVAMTDLGRIFFTCEEFFITDLLGIFSIHTGCAMEGSLYVLPPPDASTTEDIPEVCFGAMEVSESQRKGNDHSEVSDIRTYAPGDRPRDIHWKLSARHMELMVKERVSLSGSEQILLLDIPSEKEKAEKLLTEGYHQITGLLNRQMTVRVLVWNQRLFSFESYSCACAEELESAFCEIFRTDLSSRSCDLLRQYMKNCYPQLESYMCVTLKEYTIQLEICING